MNWKEIKISHDNRYFTFSGKQLFGKNFTEVLKFHEPGLATVCDKSGWYHIDIHGQAIYSQRYQRAFGFYEMRASVVLQDEWFHIDSHGEPLYQEKYGFTGNYQYGLCAVRDCNSNYFYIDISGNRVSQKNYIYAGDYKDNYACVMLANKKFKHINQMGECIYDSEFDDLGVYHKGFATAKDKKGWFHIDINGKALYPERYVLVEPFYNGCALVENLNSQKIIIDEQGKVIHRL